MILFAIARSHFFSNHFRFHQRVHSTASIFWRLIALLLVSTTSLFSQPIITHLRSVVDWPEVTRYFAVKCGDSLRYDFDRSNITITEDGVGVDSFQIIPPVKKPPQCMSVSLVIPREISLRDGSPAKWELIKLAVPAFLSRLYTTAKNCDEVALLTSFNASSSMPLDVSFTRDTSAIMNKLRQLSPDKLGGFSPGLHYAINYTATEGRRDMKALIVVTDGEDESGFSGNNEILTAQEKGVFIFVIGYGPSVNVERWSSIANQTGAVYLQAHDLTSLQKAFNDIYTFIEAGPPALCLKYILPTCRDGKQHFMELKLRGLSTCPLQGIASIWYTARSDFAFDSPRRFLIPRTHASSGEVVLMPVEAPKRVDQYMGQILCRFVFDTSLCKFLGVEESNTLLDGAQLSYQLRPDGVDIFSNNQVIIRGRGTVMRLRLKAANRSGPTYVPITCVAWTVTAGCLRITCEPGELAINAVLRLTSPKPGDQICAGDTTEITWKSSGSGTYMLLFSSDSGWTYQSLASKVYGLSYHWVVPPMTDGNYLIRILDVNLPYSDSTTSYFTIKRPPIIDKQPVPVTGCSDVGNSVNATCWRDSTVRQQWQRSDDAGKTWKDIAGATSQWYSIPPDNAFDTTSYFRAVFTNDCGTVYSNSAKVSRHRRPTIVRDIQDTIVCIGEMATFLFAVSSPVTPKYQWERYPNTGSWQPIPQAVGPTFTFRNADIALSGMKYRCGVTTLCGTIYSREATVTVTDRARIIRDLEPTMVFEGLKFILAVETENAIKYTWYKNGVKLPMYNGNILIVYAARKSDEGKYRVVVHGKCDSVSSRTIDVSVGPIVKTFVLSPISPNPIVLSESPSTIRTIQFTLPFADFIRLELIDPTGAHVKTIAEGIYQQGQHTVLFDGTGLSAGFYICRLRSSNDSAIQPMVVLR